MKYIYLLLFNIFLINAQTHDTIISNRIYNSYFSYSKKQPLFVVYKLNKGGGDCNRNKFRFKNDTNIEMLDNKFYTKSGFDRGHLANSEDFAFNCELDEMTFRYYNCLPQYPDLNRGVWKTIETKIRKQSITANLLIITGGIWEQNIYPSKCWKLVFDLTSCKITNIYIFDNKIKKSTYKEISLYDFELMVGFNIDKIINSYQ